MKDQNIRISWAEFTEFIHRYHNGDGKNLRLGQFFLNTYCNDSMPELFYEKNYKKAFIMILENFVIL